MRCRAVLLKSTGLTSEQVGEQTDMTHISVNSWVKRFETEWIKGLEHVPAEAGSQSWTARTRKQCAKP